MQFLWINIFQWKYQEFLDILKNPTKKTLAFAPKPEIRVRTKSDEEFLSILKKADYNTPDANGLYVGSMIQEGFGFLYSGFTTFFHKKLVQGRYGELIKGSDLTRDILEFSAQNQKHILILDNRVEEVRSEFDKKKLNIQKNLKTLLEQKYPGVSVQVIFVWDMKSDGIAHLIELQKISYVFSCLGMKKQESALIDIWSYLPATQEVVGLGVGASIDFLLGLQKRAPIIFQKLGLEWLYRLILEPRKRWRRIYMALVEFPRMIKNKR